MKKRPKFCISCRLDPSYRRQILRYGAGDAQLGIRSHSGGDSSCQGPLSSLSTPTSWLHFGTGGSGPIDQYWGRTPRAAYTPTSPSPTLRCVAAFSAQERGVRMTSELRSLERGGVLAYLHTAWAATTEAGLVITQRTSRRLQPSSLTRTPPWLRTCFPTR